eukprot:COSAG02_NODE_1362_length_13050_cov_22.164775_5_plen_60_part_00
MIAVIAVTEAEMARRSVDYEPERRKEQTRVNIFVVKQPLHWPARWTYCAAAAAAASSSQ